MYDAAINPLTEGTSLMRTVPMFVLSQFHRGVYKTTSLLRPLGPVLNVQNTELSLYIHAAKGRATGSDERERTCN